MTLTIGSTKLRDNQQISKYCDDSCEEIVKIFQDIAAINEIKNLKVQGQAEPWMAAMNCGHYFNREEMQQDVEKQVNLQQRSMLICPLCKN